jgi:hypothetical protein
MNSLILAVQITGFNYSTTYLLKKYLEGKTQLLYPEPKDVFPSDILASAESHPVPDAVDEPSN